MIRDAFLYVALFFVVAIGILVSYVIFDGINDAIQDQDQIPSGVKTTMSTMSDGFPTTWDYGLLTAFVGVMIGILILSWVVASNPGLFFVFLIVVTLITGFAGYLANAFGEVILDPVLGASASQFPITSFILNNYLVFTAVMIFLMLVVFFAKPNEGVPY